MYFLGNVEKYLINASIIRSNGPNQWRHPGISEREGGGGRVECLGSAGDYIDALPSNAMFCECEE